MGRDPLFGAFLPKEIAIAPGLPRTAAVVRSRPNGGSPEFDGAAIFDDAVQRPLVGGNLTSEPVLAGNVGYLNGSLTDSVVWGADASTLYGTNYETSSFDFSIYSVDAAGLHFVRNAAFNDPSKHLHFWNGRLYADRGQVLDVASESVVATLELGLRDHTQSVLVAVDPLLHKLFYLEITYPHGLYVTYKWVSFDLDSLEPIDSLTYDDFSTEKPRLDVMRFVRWGTDGLAFINDEGELYLLSGAFVDGRP